MTASPKQTPSNPNQDRAHETVCLTCFAAVGRPIMECGKLEHTRTHICDSAFLAERGILTRMGSGKGPTAAHNRTSEAA